MNNCPWLVPLTLHTFIPLCEGRQSIWGCVLWCLIGSGTELSSSHLWAMLLPMATVRITKHKSKEWGLSTKQFPFSPGKLEQESRGQEWNQEIAKQSNGCLEPALPLYHCSKNRDCRLESYLCEAEGQHFDGIIFTQMHVCTDFDEWNCNTETSVQFLHRECRKEAVELWGLANQHYLNGWSCLFAAKVSRFCGWT